MAAGCARHASPLRWLAAAGCLCGSGLPACEGSGPHCLVFSPATLDFGTVVPGMAITQEVAIANRCTDSITVVPPPSQAPFSLGPVPPSSLTLGNDEQLFFPITFTPTDAGPATGTLAFGGSNSADLPVRGRGGNPLSCTPPALDFGTVGGASLALDLTCSNAGGPTSPPLRLTVVSSDRRFSVTCAEPAACVSPAPGASVSLTVTYRPASPSETATGTLAVGAGLAGSPPLAIPLRGSSVQPLEACALSVSPSPLALGALLPGSLNNVTLTFSNSGGKRCDFTAALAEQAALGSPFWSSSPSAPQSVAPGATASLTLPFQVPAGEGDYEFDLALNFAGANAPLGLAVGTFQVVDSCLAVSSSSLQLLYQRCESPAAILDLYNRCSEPLTLLAPVVEPSASGAYFGVDSPPLPIRLTADNPAVDLFVRFLPGETESQSAQLILSDSVDAAPLTVQLEGSAPPYFLDRFTVDDLARNPEVFPLTWPPVGGAAGVSVALNGTMLSRDLPNGPTWTYLAPLHALAIDTAWLSVGDSIEASYALACH